MLLPIRLFPILESPMIGIRRLVTRLGAEFHPQYSLRWARILRPGAALAGGIAHRTRGRGQFVGHALRVLGSAVDSAARVPLRRLDPAPRRRPLTVRPLRPEHLVEHADRVLDPSVLRPDLSCAETIESQWSWLPTLRPEGEHHRIGLWNARDELVGWLLLHLWPSGTGEVVQLLCRPEHSDAAVATTIAYATELGAGSIHGRAGPSTQMALGEAGAVFHSRGAAFGLICDDRAILDQFRTGDAIVTGLEGEYPMQLARSRG